VSKKIILNIGLVFVLIIISIFFVACSTIKNPVLIGVNDVELGDNESEGITLNLDLNVYNPNWFNIKAKDVDFNIYIDTLHFGYGSFKNEILIPKRDTVVINSSININNLNFSSDISFKDSLLADIYGSASISFYPKKYHFHFQQEFSFSDYIKPLLKDFLSEGSIEVKELKVKEFTLSKINMEILIDFYNKSNIGYKIKNIEIEIFEDKKYKKKIGESSIDKSIFIRPNKTTEIVSEIELDAFSSGLSWLKNKLQGENFVFVKIKASVNYNNLIFPFVVKKKISYGGGDFEMD